MIKLFFSLNNNSYHIKVKGHEVSLANDKKEFHLICAAVSSQITIFANFMEHYKLDHDLLEIKINDGSAVFILNDIKNCKNNDLKFIFKLLQDGLLLLSRQYPLQIQVI